MTGADRLLDLPYLIRVTDWSFPYILSVYPLKDSGDPFWEYRAIVVSGVLELPTSTELSALAKVSHVEIRIWPTVSLNEESRQRDKPDFVGFMNTDASKFEASLYLPAEMLQPILTTLSAGQLKFIKLDGDKIRHRQGTIRTYAFN